MFNSEMVEKVRTFMNIPLGAEVFDPRLIISQIIIMQTSHYFILGFILLIFDLFSSNYLCLDQYFNYKLFNLRTLFGALTFTAWIINAFFGAFALYFVVQRTKKCLDFSITVYVIHLLICIFYKGFPLRWEWWILNISNVVIMTLVGEFLCYRRELQYIPVKKTISKRDPKEEKVEIKEVAKETIVEIKEEVV